MTSAYDPIYQKRWRYDRARGVARVVPAERVRLHIATLQGAGWSLRAVAGTAGVATTTVYRIARGEQTTVRVATAAAILRVDPTGLPSGDLPTGYVPPKGQGPAREVNVPVLGTRRRIRALMRMGWSPRDIAERLGEHERWVYNRLNQSGQWCRKSTHDRVAAVYRELSHKRGPSERTRRYAEKHGYEGPLAWDDIDHDLEPDLGEPEGRVSFYDDYDEAVVARLVEGGERVTKRLTPREADEAVRRLLARGVSTHMIERVYHLNAARAMGRAS